VEKGTYCVPEYLSFIQHKNLQILCSPYIINYKITHKFTILLNFYLPIRGEVPLPYTSPDLVQNLMDAPTRCHVDPCFKFKFFLNLQLLGDGKSGSGSFTRAYVIDLDEASRFSEGGPKGHRPTQRLQNKASE
jgi:hypothetical protein